jgi:O-antigen ligase
MRFSANPAPFRARTGSMPPPTRVAAAAAPTTSRGRIEPYESVLVLGALMLAMATFGIVLHDTGGDRTASSKLFAPLAAGIYGLCLLLGSRGLPRDWWRSALRAWPLLLLVGYAVMSTAWSATPGAALRRAIALLMTMAFAFYVTQRFRPEEFFRILYVAFGLYIAVELLSVVLPPHIGIYGSGLFQGAWRGLTGMKNILGRTLGLMLVLFVVMRHFGGRSWYRLSLAGCGAVLVMLFFSRSRTPLLAAAAAIPTVYALRMLMGGVFGRGWRLKPTLGLVAGLLLAAVAVMAVLVVAPLVLEAVGRDFTLSGRTKLWGWAINIASARPWLGAGYRSFWIDANTKYFFTSFAWQKNADGTLSDSYHGPDHSHSSYVDTFVELGIVGCALLAVLILSSLWRMRTSFRANDIAALPYAAVTIYLLFYGLTERAFLQHTLDVWMLFMIHYFYTASRLRRRVLAAGASNLAAAPFRPVPVTMAARLVR